MKLPFLFISVLYGILWCDALYHGLIFIMVPLRCPWNWSWLEMKDSLHCPHKLRFLNLDGWCNCSWSLITMILLLVKVSYKTTLLLWHDQSPPVRHFCGYARMNKSTFWIGFLKIYCTVLTMGNRPHETWSFISKNLQTPASIWMPPPILSMPLSESQFQCPLPPATSKVYRTDRLFVLVGEVGCFYPGEFHLTPVYLVPSLLNLPHWRYTWSVWSSPIQSSPIPNPFTLGFRCRR